MVCNANQILLDTQTDNEMGEIVASMGQKYIHGYGEET